MDIRKQNSQLVLSAIFILGVALINASYVHAIEVPSSSQDDSIIDKVFTFEIGGPSLNLSGLGLDPHYTYYTRVQIVTPNWCNITVQIADPDKRIFRVYDGILADQEWQEIPFGVAVAGAHSFAFEVESIYNVNIHIKISKEYYCLIDKVDEWEPHKFVLYEVTRFSEDDSNIIHEFNLLSDYRYKFYIGRVSAEGNLSTVDYMDLVMSDPDDLPFVIFEYAPIPGVADVERFQFATSQVGTYTLEIDVDLHKAHENINVAYVLISLGLIATGSNSSTTNSTDDSPIRYDLPSEVFLISGVGIIGSLFFIGMVLTVKNKKFRQDQS